MNESTLREFYEHVFPIELLVRWLSYVGPMDVAKSEGIAKAENADAADFSDGQLAKMKGASSTHHAASSYLARREFCFTLMGDIFTRFRSYSSAAELKAELCRNVPEKIDAGAVYNVRPSQKQGAANVVPVERELVFDIDMSDYDNVRSCCEGKSICSYCWAWMSCAAQVLRTVLVDDFGFKYLLPVFSGRRGVHLWVCDRRARALHDDERAALVGYLTVVMPKTLRSSVVADLANHRPIHPTIRRVLINCLETSFLNLFVQSEEVNPNNMQHHPKPASIVYQTVISVLKQGRREALQAFLREVQFEEGQVLSWATLCRGLGSPADVRDVLHATQLLLMYPRLDEHVSTRRDHLLKLPFCVHPGSLYLCTPLEWDELPTFNPSRDPPTLERLLVQREIEPKWLAPLEEMLSAMTFDPEERYGVGEENTAL